MYEKIMIMLVLIISMNIITPVLQMKLKSLQIFPYKEKLVC